MDGCQPIAACGAILAGGQSRRMGQDKALVPFDGEPLIGRVARRFRDWFTQALIVTNTPASYAFTGLPMTGDPVPGLGPLGGLAAALQASQHPLVFLTACDMPFTDRRLISLLIDLAPGFDAVVPTEDGIVHPLHAVYARSCLTEANAQLSRGSRRMTDLLQRLHVRYVAEVELATVGDSRRLLFNCNTPADLEHAKRWEHDPW